MIVTIPEVFENKFGISSNPLEIKSPSSMNKRFCSQFILWISSPSQTSVRDLITGLVVVELTFKNLSRNFLNLDFIVSNFF